MIRPGKLPSHYRPASALGIAMGACCFVVLSKVLCELQWPFPVSFWDQHMTGWIALRLHAIEPSFFPKIATRYSAYLDQLPTGINPRAVTARFDIAGLLAGIVGVAVTWLVGRPLSDTKILAGRRLYEGKAAHRRLKKIAQEEMAVSGVGIKLHPGFDWHLSRERETRHFMLVGSVGGGKTQILTPMVLAAIGRSDRVLIYDTKADFTSTLPVDFALLAPWDSRSMVWDVARDCVNAQDARELAAQLIPTGQDPMWHQAARQILTAVIQQLQAYKADAWTWKDLHQLSASSQEDLLNIVSRFTPEAANLLAGESKTTDGILINLSASLSIVADLAAAWGYLDSSRRFSFSEWLLNPNYKYKTVVLQGSGRYAELARGYVKGSISLLAGRINSAELADDRDRRVWLFLDEFPQLGKLEKISSIIEVGRSKGVCVVLGAQDMAQVQETYGQYVGKTWGSMIGTQFVVRVNSGDTAQWLAKEVIGYEKIEKTVMHEGKPQPAQTQDQLVLEPSELSDYLGPDKSGVRAVALGFGHAFIVTWPYTTLPILRSAVVPAKWTFPTQTPPNNHEGEVMKSKSHPAQGTGGSASTQSGPEPKLKLKLRTPTPEEIHEMAVTGSDIRVAAEPMNDMSPTPNRGGDQ